MSYILEALKKAEQERNLGKVPTFSSYASNPPPARRSLWPWVLITALLINGVALLAISKSWKPGYFSVDHSIVKSDPVQPQKPEPLPEPLLAALGPPESPESPGFASQPPDFHQRLASIPPAMAFSDPMEEAFQEPVQNVTYETSWSNSGNFDMELPTSLPELNLDIHVFSENTHKKFVVINSHRYREGERLSEGPLLESITTAGAILRYRNDNFLLPVHPR